MKRKAFVNFVLIVVFLVSVFLISIFSGTVDFHRFFGFSASQSTVDATDWWPMFHHDLSHTGTSTSTGPTTNNIRWTYTTGSGVYSSPAVAGGLVYVGSDDSNVYCLDVATGAFVWRHPTGGPVVSSPAVAGGLVYVGSDDYSVYCLDVATGAFVWRYPTTFYVESSPVVVGGLVYVGSDDCYVYCLNAATGSLVWRSWTGGEVWSSPAVVGGLVYVGSYDGYVLCLNAATGARVWLFLTSAQVYSSPAVVGGFAYVGSYDGNVYCLNAATGSLVWSYPTSYYVHSSPAVAGGLVYVGSFDGSVYCLNAATGASVWRYQTGGWVYSSPAVVSGLVYVGSYDNNVYCLNAATGALVWSYKTGNIVDASPALVNGVACVGSGDGDIYAFGSPPTVSISPTSVTMDVGQSHLFTSTVSGGMSPYSYQWYLNSAPVSGATNPTWTFTPSSTGSYTVYLKVTDAASAVATSNTATVTVNGALSASISPGSATLDVGQSQQFTSSVSGGTPPFTYQWYLNGVAVPGATSATWTFTPSSRGSYTVYVKVTDNVGMAATSNTATVAVNSALSVTISPTSVTLDVGQSQQFTSSVSGGTPPFTYQWYLNGVAVPGATNPTWTFTPSSTGSYTVYLKVTDAAGSTLTSTATATVNPALSVSISPGSVVIDLNQPQLFTEAVSGGTPPYTYQWYRDDVAVSGAISSSWKFTPSSAGSHKVSVIVTDKAGVTLTSTATATVNPVLSTDFDPSRDSYSQINSGNKWATGNCYGCSSTEIKYFMNYILGNKTYPYLPAQDPPTSTSDLNLPQNHDTLNNAALAIMFSQLYDPNNGYIPPSSENTEYNKLVGTLGIREPVLLEMRGIDSKGKDVYHTIVAYGIVMNPDGTVSIKVSDPNVPQQEEIADYNPSTQTFSYTADGLSFYYEFEVFTPEAINKSWAPAPWWYLGTYWWWHDWLSFSVSGYNIVIADKSVTIKSGELIDKFTQMGNSQTFVKGIPGSCGIEDGNVQVYAIPAGTPYTISDPGSNQSTILITRVDNESGQLVGYGYLLNATTEGPLNFTVTPSSSGLSITTGDNALNASVTFFSATQQSHSIFQTSNVSVDSMQTVNFPVANWQMLNGVVPSKSVVGQGFSTSIYVTVANPMDYAETFNITAYANAISIASQNVTLSSGNSTTITFSWNTTGLDYGNYAISAVADTGPGETATANSNYTGSNIIVTIPGDVVAPFFKVDMGDISAVLDAFGSKLGPDGNYWHHPPGLLDPFSPDRDIDGNGQVDMGDIVTALGSFGQHYP